MAKRRRDRWGLGDAYSLPEAARGGPELDLPVPDPVLAWVQFPDRILEVEARVLAYTDRAVLISGVSVRAPIVHGCGAMRSVLCPETFRPEEGRRRRPCASSQPEGSLRPQRYDPD